MDAVSKDLIPALNDSFELNLPGSISMEELKEKLRIHINHLINHNFEKLISLLYRIDVDETKLRNLLRQSHGDSAAALISSLIIERQLQKIRSRSKFLGQKNISEDEKW